MKILITGITGLVGTQLYQAIKDKHAIHFLTTQKSKLNALQGAKGFYWNPTNGEIDAACIEGVDTIIHLSGASISKRWTKKYKKQILDSRVKGTHLLVEMLKQQQEKHSVKQVVAASAIGIYPSSENRTYHEDYPLAPSSNFLEQVVVAWEKAVDEFSSLAIVVAKLRIGLVLTATGGVLAPLKIPTFFGFGAAFGNGKQYQSWIHVNDLVTLLLVAAEQKWEGVYNAVSPEAVTQTYFTKTLAKAMNRPYFMPPIPKIFIQLLVGEMSVLILNSHQISADKIVQKGFVFQHTDLQKAIKSLL